MKTPKNVGVSARDRLTALARTRRENAQLLMTRYAIERLLHRLGASRHRDRFVLKGAMLFSLWAPVPYRATGDLDLLGFGSNAPAALTGAFAEILAEPVEDDGLVFGSNAVRAAPARSEDEYSGVRLDLSADLGGARLPIHVDVGFGDRVTPDPVEIEYPSILGQSPPRLRAYPPETVVAEKLQAMVELGALNTRMKDFFDLWAIAGTFTFDAILVEAIRRTFAQRRTAMPIALPPALTSEFATTRQVQWRAFLRRTEIALAPEPFPDVQARIASLLMPVARAIIRNESFQAVWAPGGPWQAP